MDLFIRNITKEEICRECGYPYRVATAHSEGGGGSEIQVKSACVCDSRSMNQTLSGQDGPWVELYPKWVH